MTVILTQTFSTGLTTKIRLEVVVSVTQQNKTLPVL